MPDWAEEKFAGIDRPRPLEPEAAERLSRTLIQAGTGEPLSLGGQLSSRLEDALSDPLVPVMDDLGAPRPLEAATRKRLEEALGARRHRPRLVLAAAAALVVLAGAGAALATVGGTSSPPPTRAIGGGAGSGAPGGTSAGASAGSGSAGPPAPSAAAPTAGPGGVSANATANRPPAGSPEVTGLDPDNGPTAGGTWVTVSGAGFEGVTAVRFGTASATFQVISGAELRARAPGHSAATVDVRVTTGAGTSAAVAGDRFRYR